MAVSKKEFKKLTPEKRIESVIADGQWITIQKLASSSYTKAHDVKQWLEENKNSIVVSKNGESYRAPSSWVIDWYEKNNLNFDDEIVPNNYPARVWGGKTETEHFIDNPVVTLSKINIENCDSNILHKIENAVRGAGFFREEEKKIAFHCVDPDYVIDRIKMVLTPYELKQIKLKPRRGFRRRDVSMFSDKFLVEAFDFYIPYARNLLSPHMKTIRVFLKEKEDRDMQILEWLYMAMEKYDETKPVPFAGYFANVLRFWPYSLPENELGRELSQFQREKSRLVEKEQQNFVSEHIPDEHLANLMDMDLEKFKRLNVDNNQWVAFYNATDIYTETEIIGSSLDLDTKERETKNSRLLAYNISLAIIKATVDTGEHESALELIKLMEDTSSIPEHVQLTDSFKYSLGAYLKEYLQEDIYEEQEAALEDSPN